MSLHKEISFELEICQHLAANGWLVFDDVGRACNLLLKSSPKARAISLMGGLPVNFSNKRNARSHAAWLSGLRWSAFSHRT